MKEKKENLKNKKNWYDEKIKNLKDKLIEESKKDREDKKEYIIQSYRNALDEIMDIDNPSEMVYKEILDHIDVHKNKVLDIWLKSVPFGIRLKIETEGRSTTYKTKILETEQVKKSGFGAYYVDHTAGVWPQAASGVPFSAATFQSVGDPITDLSEDLAAEQKARTTYDNLLRLIDDPDVREPLKFLREREIVHFQRFGEALRTVQDHLDSKNFYAINPAFDHSGNCNK